MLHHSIFQAFFTLSGHEGRGALGKHESQPQKASDPWITGTHGNHGLQAPILHRSSQVSLGGLLFTQPGTRVPFGNDEDLLEFPPNWFSYHKSLADYSNSSANKEFELIVINSDY